MNKKYFAWLRLITPIVYDNSKSIYEVISEIIPILIELKENQNDFSSEMDKHYKNLETKKQELETKMNNYTETFKQMITDYRNVYNASKKDIKDTIEDIVNRYQMQYSSKLNNLKNIYDSKSKDIRDTIENICEQYTRYYNEHTTDFNNYVNTNKQDLSNFIQTLLSDVDNFLTQFYNNTIGNWETTFGSKNFNEKQSAITNLVNDVFKRIIEKLNNLTIENEIPKYIEEVNNIFSSYIINHYPRGTIKYIQNFLNQLTYDTIPYKEYNRVSQPVSNNIYRGQSQYSNDKNNLYIGHTDKINFNEYDYVPIDNVLIGDLTFSLFMGIANDNLFYMYGDYNYNKSFKQGNIYIVKENLKTKEISRGIIASTNSAPSTKPTYVLPKTKGNLITYDTKNKCYYALIYDSIYTDVHLKPVKFIDVIDEEKLNFTTFTQYDSGYKGTFEGIGCVIVNNSACIGLAGLEENGNVYPNFYYNTLNYTAHNSKAGFRNKDLYEYLSCSFVPISQPYYVTGIQIIYKAYNKETKRIEYVLCSNIQGYSDITHNQYFLDNVYTNNNIVYYPYLKTFSTGDTKYLDYYYQTDINKGKILNGRNNDINYNLGKVMLLPFGFYQKLDSEDTNIYCSDLFITDKSINKSNYCFPFDIKLTDYYIVCDNANNNIYYAKDYGNTPKLYTLDIEAHAEPLINYLNTDLNTKFQLRMQYNYPMSGVNETGVKVNVKWDNDLKAFNVVTSQSEEHKVQGIILVNMNMLEHNDIFNNFMYNFKDGYVYKISMSTETDTDGWGWHVMLGTSGAYILNTDNFNATNYLKYNKNIPTLDIELDNYDYQTSIKDLNGNFIITLEEMQTLLDALRLYGKKFYNDNAFQLSYDEDMDEYTFNSLKANTINEIELVNWKNCAYLKPNHNYKLTLKSVTNPPNNELITINNVSETLPKEDLEISVTFTYTDNLTIKFSGNTNPAFVNYKFQFVSIEDLGINEVA